MEALRKINKTGAVVNGLFAAYGMMFITGTTTFSRSAVGIGVALITAAYSLWQE